VGRWAIAEKLIRCERDDSIFGPTTVGDPLDQTLIDDDWYAYLFNILTESITRLEDVGKLPISFITFNYDRSLEYFLTAYLVSNFPSESFTAVREVVKQIEILHVYGRLDKLPTEEEYGRDYLDTITPEIVMKAAAEIKVLHEGDENNNEFRRARELMTAADAILFLGFGYHAENMRRLQVPFDRLDGRAASSSIKQIRQIFGTVYKLTGPETNIIQHLYSNNRMTVANTNHTITDALRHNLGFLSMVR
jgi:hypothetical protein